MKRLTLLCIVAIACLSLSACSSNSKSSSSKASSSSKVIKKHHKNHNKKQKKANPSSNSSSQARQNNNQQSQQSGQSNNGRALTQGEINRQRGYDPNGNPLLPGQDHAAGSNPDGSPDAWVQGQLDYYQNNRTSPNDSGANNSNTISNQTGDTQQ